MACGTPSYMPPEILKKKEYEGPPADMWSLGVVLYAMLHGCYPFRGQKPESVYIYIYNVLLYMYIYTLCYIYAYNAHLFICYPFRGQKAESVYIYIYIYIYNMLLHIYIYICS